MPWLNRNAHFDPDSFNLPILGIAGELRHHNSGTHQHQLGQLLFPAYGCMQVTLQNQVYMLPPNHIAWIPPTTPHSAETTTTVGYRSVFLDVNKIQSLPNQIEIFEASHLLSASLEWIATASFDTNWHNGHPANVLAVCLNEIHLASRNIIALKLPSDRRLKKMPTFTLPPSLKLLATQVGASEKTISRIFLKETGLNYQQWRQQWRLQKAIELLSAKNSLSFIANELGFASDSAFIAFFKRVMSLSPQAYKKMTPQLP